MDLKGHYKGVRKESVWIALTMGRIEAQDIKLNLSNIIRESDCNSFHISRTRGTWL